MGIQLIDNMKKTFNYLFFISTAIIFLTCCTTPLLVPSEHDAERSHVTGNNISLADLQSGHQLYISKCGNCHYLYRPNKLSEEQWKKKIPEMAAKAKISSMEQGRILHYLVAMHDAYEYPQQAKK